MEGSADMAAAAGTDGNAAALNSAEPGQQDVVEV
jgi:hypothetical protein